MTPEPLSGTSPTPTRSEELGRLVRSWRERLDPLEIPGPYANSTRSRRRKRVSQEQAAAIIGYSVGWISSLERGEQKNYSVDFLDRVAYTLRLSSDEKKLLFLLATGHEPGVVIRDSPMKATETIRRLLDAQPWPAYVNDEAWDLVAYNRHMQDWFPWVAGHETNVMRWVFTYPEARRQLHCWDTEWGPQMLAQMRFAHARMPDNERLTEIITEILRSNADARRFWDRPTISVHPDGNRRSLYLPNRQRIQRIEIVALELMRAPGSRFVTLLPTGTEPADDGP